MKSGGPYTYVKEGFGNFPVPGSLGVMGIMAPAELQHSAAPFADASRIIWGEWASGLIRRYRVFRGIERLDPDPGSDPPDCRQGQVIPTGIQKGDPRGVPVPGILIASVLASILVSFNYTRGLVECSHSSSSLPR